MGDPTPPPEPTTVSRYVCGECEYDRTAPWPEHNAHYRGHQGDAS